MPRFTVHTVTGYRLTPTGENSRRGTRSKPGLTAYIVDNLTGNQTGPQWHSEDAPQWAFDRHGWALRMAREHARGLEANHA